MPEQDGTVSVAVINDYEIVVHGVRRMLEDFAPQIQVVELDVHAPVAGSVDVVLYDAFSQSYGESWRVEEVLRSSGADKVIVYTWNVDASAIEEALALGVHGYLSKAVGAQELAEAIVRVHQGERVVSEAVDAEAELPVTAGDWPGREHGLTAREAEIVALITRGLSNKDIAERTYLSINSVKSYIRTAYRRMGVTSRSQAVLWGIRHGMALETPKRVIDA